MSNRSNECCNPTARSDAERCLHCPMRKNSLLEQVQQQTQVSDANKPEAPKRKLTWQELYGDLNDRF